MPCTLSFTACVYVYSTACVCVVESVYVQTAECICVYFVSVCLCVQVCVSVCE